MNHVLKRLCYCQQHDLSNVSNEQINIECDCKTWPSHRKIHVEKTYATEKDKGNWQNVVTALPSGRRPKALGLIFLLSIDSNWIKNKWMPDLKNKIEHVWWITDFCNNKFWYELLICINKQRLMYRGGRDRSPFRLWVQSGILIIKKWH